MWREAEGKSFMHVESHPRLLPCTINLLTILRAVLQVNPQSTIYAKDGVHYTQEVQVCVSYVFATLYPRALIFCIGWNSSKKRIAAEVEEQVSTGSRLIVPACDRNGDVSRAERLGAGFTTPLANEPTAVVAKNKEILLPVVPPIASSTWSTLEASYGLVLVLAATRCFEDHIALLSLNYNLPRLRGENPDSPPTNSKSIIVAGQLYMRERGLDFIFTEVIANESYWQCQRPDIPQGLATVWSGTHASTLLLALLSGELLEGMGESYYGMRERHETAWVADKDIALRYATPANVYGTCVQVLLLGTAAGVIRGFEFVACLNPPDRVFSLSWDNEIRPLGTAPPLTLATARREIFRPLVGFTASNVAQAVLDLGKISPLRLPDDKLTYSMLLPPSQKYLCSEAPISAYAGPLELAQHCNWLDLSCPVGALCGAFTPLLVIEEGSWGESNESLVHWFSQVGVQARCVQPEHFLNDPQYDALVYWSDRGEQLAEHSLYRVACACSVSKDEAARFCGGLQHGVFAVVSLLDGTILVHPPTSTENFANASLPVFSYSRRHSSNERTRLALQHLFPLSFASMYVSQLTYPPIFVGSKRGISVWRVDTADPSVFSGDGAMWWKLSRTFASEQDHAWFKFVLLALQVEQPAYCDDVFGPNEVNWIKVQRNTSFDTVTKVTEKEALTNLDDTYLMIDWCMGQVICEGLKEGFDQDKWIHFSYEPSLLMPRDGPRPGEKRYTPRPPFDLKRWLQDYVLWRLREEVKQTGALLPCEAVEEFSNRALTITPSFRKKAATFSPRMLEIFGIHDPGLLRSVDVLALVNGEASSDDVAPLVGPTHVATAVRAANSLFEITATAASTPVSIPHQEGAHRVLPATVPVATISDTVRQTVERRVKQQLAQQSSSAEFTPRNVARCSPPLAASTPNRDCKEPEQPRVEVSEGWLFVSAPHNFKSSGNAPVALLSCPVPHYEHASGTNVLVTGHNKKTRTHAARWALDHPHASLSVPASLPSHIPAIAE
jgi:hypothetical protein